MQHDTPLISTIVAGLVLAYIFGMIANRFRLPPLVGYLFAGILVGPHTPGYVADQALGVELAELGVILLMFGVGLHFSLKDLMSVRALAIPGALAQIALATLLGLGLGLLMGWGVAAGLLFGLALSVASTVVLLKAMQDRRLIETERGRIAVGWLIVEDLAMVLALVLIPALAGLLGSQAVVHDPFVSFVERVSGLQVNIWGVLGLTVVKLAAFVGFMLVVGRRIIPWALHGTAHTGSRELFRLAVLAIALGVALGSAVLFGVSLALGAFFAGMILSESELSHRAAQETLPLRDAFSVLFFVSVGMLFDPAILITNPLPVLATVFIIVVGKSVAAYGIVILFKRPISTALTISASLAQIGEFSFILASMGVSLAILPAEGQDLILAGALISIVLNPVLFWVVDAVKPRFEAKSAQRKSKKAARDGTSVAPTEPTMDAPAVPVSAEALPVDGSEGEDDAVVEDDDLDDDDTPEPITLVGHTVLVGFGRVGRVIGEGLHAAAAPLVVIEDGDPSIAAARALGIDVVVGNAASAEVLELANLAAAQCLVIAIPNGFEAGTVCEVGRKLNPTIRIIARVHSEEEETHLRSLGADTVIMGEREIGLGMLAWLRGERSEPVEASDIPGEPKLPPVENLLAKASATPAGATTEIPIIEAIVAPEDEATPEADEGNSTADQDAPRVPDAAVIEEIVDPELAAQEADETSESGIAPEVSDAPQSETPADTDAETVAPDVNDAASAKSAPDAVPDASDAPKADASNDEAAPPTATKKPRRKKAPPVLPEPKQ